MIGAIVAENRQKFILDYVSGAFSALSTRRLNAAFTSRALRLRNGTSNAEADINLDYEALNESQITAHLGAATGFVRIWSGIIGALSPAIATAANQPVLSKSLNGRYALVFDGSNDSLNDNVGVPRSSLYFTLCMTLAAPASGIVLQYSTNSDGADKRITVGFSSNKIGVRIYDSANGGYYYDKISVNNVTGNAIIVITNNNKTVTVEVNGTEISMVNASAFATASPTACFIGSDRGFATWSAVTLGEIITFERALTVAERNDYLQDAKRYWGIT